MYNHQRASSSMPPRSVISLNSSGDYHSPYPSILNTLFFLSFYSSAIQCTTLGFSGLQTTRMSCDATFSILLENVCNQNALSLTLQLMAVRMLLADRLQRYMGASTKRVAMGVQAMSLGNLEGSSWYLSQMAAGMKSSPAMMTKYPCNLAVLVLRRVKVEALQRGIWLSRCSRILAKRVEMSCGESCFCLKLDNSQDSGINNNQYYPQIVQSSPKQTNITCIISPSSFSISLFLGGISSVYNSDQSRWPKEERRDSASRSSSSGILVSGEIRRHRQDLADPPVHPRQVQRRVSGDGRR